jgi:hypothetical protein
VVARFAISLLSSEKQSRCPISRRAKIAFRRDLANSDHEI